MSFLEKHVRVLTKIRTCFSENTYVFQQKHNRVFITLIYSALKFMVYQACSCIILIS